ncbi:hypothetical protein D9756_006407 [Leucocoprinus leucothites]|uniref:ferric-chelate reductase (NADPH) n=1 Tax=Leucocoprinus leucothites TaxID=201217 RepID=A0A8H5G268_9AGAR|nr:hypothetical protein D9756_006407 [Leucoagaricus leucothites]
MAGPPPLSVTSHLPTAVDIYHIPVDPQAPNPDRTIRVAHAHTYPIHVWYFHVSLIFLATLANIIGLGLGYYRDRRRRQQSKRRALTDAIQTQGVEPSIRVEGLEQEETRGPINLWRTPCAALNTFRALSFRWTISVGQLYSWNIAEVVLTAVYAATCFTWVLVNTTSTDGVKFDPHYYANIAGTTAAIQFPLLVALGMKNNIISYLTGVGLDKQQQKLVFLHRIVARVMLVLIGLHAGGRIQLGLTGPIAITVPVIRAGPLAATALTLLSIISIRPIRDRAYEFFLIAHLVLGVICVLSVYFHAGSLYFGHFLWPAILLWGLDRALRLFRIALSTVAKDTTSSESASRTFGVHLFAAAKPRVEFLSADFILLTVPRPRFFYWRPGQSVYLSFPGVSVSPFEAHPFTIAAIPTYDNDPGSGNEVKSWTGELEFCMRVRSGLTKRLLPYIDGGKDFNVFLDGPYNSSPVLVGYDSVLLIAGGSGVGFTLPLFLDLLQRTKKDGPACRRLTFVWTVRHFDKISWIRSKLSSALRNPPPNIIINVHLFITGSAKTKVQNFNMTKEIQEVLGEDSKSAQDEKSVEDAVTSKVDDTLKKGAGSGSDSGSSGSTSPAPPGDRDFLALPIEIHQSRANFDELLKNEVALARDNMSVNVCGPRALASVVQTAVRYPRIADILRGGPIISLHVEASGSG